MLLALFTLEHEIVLWFFSSLLLFFAHHHRQLTAVWMMQPCGCARWSCLVSPQGSSRCWSPFSLLPCKIFVWLCSLGVKRKGDYLDISSYEYCWVIIILFTVARGTALPLVVGKVKVLSLFLSLCGALPGPQTSGWGSLLCKEMKFTDRSLEVK